MKIRRAGRPREQALALRSAAAQTTATSKTMVTTSLRKRRWLMLKQSASPRHFRRAPWQQFWMADGASSTAVSMVSSPFITSQSARPASRLCEAYFRPTARAGEIRLRPGQARRLDDRSEAGDDLELCFRLRCGRPARGAMSHAGVGCGFATALKQLRPGETVRLAALTAVPSSLSTSQPPAGFRRRR